MNARYKAFAMAYEANKMRIGTSPWNYNQTSLSTFKIAKKNLTGGTVIKQTYRIVNAY